MLTPGRPTLRLLSEDLDEGWTDPNDRRVANGDLDAATKPLHCLEHPVVEKGASDFTVQSSVETDLKREGITDLSNPMWWKLKTGRWRGAVYQDDDGQAWVCAAGLRRGKESSDFYQAFMADVKANGPERFLPTERDRELLSDERSVTAFEKWEQALQEQARSAVSLAQGDGMVSLELRDPDGAHFGTLTVAISVDELDPGEELHDIYLEFTCADYAYYEFLEWAETVMCLAIDPHEQAWRPTSVKDGRAYSFLLDAADSATFFAALESDFLQPGESIPGQHAHWTHRARLTESTVNGDAVKGLCGQWFVPRQDHADKPPCQRCEAVHQRLPD